MDEEITIIDSNTRNEKIRNFFINNKKSLIASVLIVIVLLTSYFSFNAIKEKNKIKLANKFNLAIAEFETVKKAETIEKLINVIVSSGPYVQYIWDAPQSELIIIFAFLGNESLAVYGCFLILQLRTKIPFTTNVLSFAQFYVV